MDSKTFSLEDRLRGRDLMGFLPSRLSVGQSIRSAKGAFVGEIADLQLAMSNSNPTPAVGDVITFNVEVGNIGPIDYRAGATIQDVLPAGLTFVSTSSSTGSYDPATGTWTSSVQIPVGVTQSFTIEARVDSLGAIVNTATLTSSDANGSNNTVSNTLNAPCFATGTGIRVWREGAEMDVAVEALVIGDFVGTAAGAHRPIRWLGHRTVDCRNQDNPIAVLPIRIAAHALGNARPARDLFVSPGHAICVDVLGEVLIPAISLVNGSTIQQVKVDEVTYWHVELDSHDVILAENLPAESYLDMGNRSFFKEANIVDFAAGPDAAPAQRTHADFCRPFVDGGAVLDAVKAQLRRRAESLGWAQSDALEMHLVVDGQRLAPVVRGLTARFEVPADAKDVWLEAPTARPCDVSESGDSRDLGVFIRALRIDDGFEVRDVAIDDPLLCIGFHPVEEGSMRWTTGRARLPAALFEGFEESSFLRIELAAKPVPRWVAPAVAERPRLAIVA